MYKFSVAVKKNVTHVYFVRHAHPDYSVHDDLLRPLSKRGLLESKNISKFLIDKKIDILFSSPYKRAVDTIKDFSLTSNLKINIVDEFKERKVDSYWISKKDFDELVKKQWKDFEYCLPNGESLKDVQKRNIISLNKILAEHEEKNIVIATHGTSLGTIINFYNNDFGYREFQRMRFIMPYIIIMNFKGYNFLSIKEKILK